MPELWWHGLHELRLLGTAVIAMATYIITEIRTYIDRFTVAATSPDDAVEKWRNGFGDYIDGEAKSTLAAKDSAEVA